MLYDIVLEGILKNKEIKESGGYIGVPFPHERLRAYLPCLQPGWMVGILGGTGVGKSRYARFLTVYTVYNFYKKTGYKTKIIYLPLEDSKEKVYKNLICHYLMENYNIRISLQELDSMGDVSLPDFVRDALIEAREFYKDLEEVVYIIDGISTPLEIFESVKEVLLDPEIGREEEYETEVQGKMVKQKRYEAFYHVFVLVDNYSNIDLDTGHATERAAVIDFAKNYARLWLCNFYRCTVVQVLQTDFQTERQQYSSSDGKAIMSKVEPSLASIGDVKTIARSLHLILSLFDPYKFEFLWYPQVTQAKLKEDPNAHQRSWDLGVLQNKFRILRVLKNNDGDSSGAIKTGLLMDAMVETFEELPAPDDPKMEAVYKRFGKTGEAAPVKLIKIDRPPMFEDNGEELPF